MQVFPPNSNAAVPVPDFAASREAELTDSARRFEAAFIATMLKEAGFGDALTGDAGFGGEAVSSLLVDRYAEMIAENGGFKLQPQILRALARADNE